MNLLVDTNVISYIYRKDSRGTNYERHLNNNFLLISFMTLDELKLWAASRNWGERKKALLAEFLTDYLVIFPDNEICGKWASVVDHCQRSGKPIAVADAWVAAVALTFDLPLVTHNVRHFDSIPDLKIISDRG